MATSGSPRRSTSQRSLPLLPWLAGVAGVVLAGALVGWFVLDALAADRERPRTAACQGNLRKIGQALRMYASDNDETLPSSGNGAETDVAGILEPYVTQLGGRPWKCPSQTPFAEGIWTSSYGYNWQYLLEPGPDYPHNDWHGIRKGGLKLAAIARPGQTLAFVDHKPVLEKPYAQLYSYVVRPSQDRSKPYDIDGMGRPDFRHHRQANVLFCDGHVKAMGSEIAQPSSEPRYWNPR